MHIPSHPVHTAAHCNPLQPTAKHPVHIQCTHCSSHYIFSAPTTAAITSLVHPLQQPLHLQCTHCSSHYIFSAHTAAAIKSSVHTTAYCNPLQLTAKYPVHTLQQPLHLQCTLQPCTAMYSYLQPIFSAHCSQLQPSATTYTAAIPFNAHCSYTI